MPTILVTNDDGIHAPGLAALADAVRPLGDILVVAPHQESSAIGHALTLRRPLRLEQHGPGRYAVDGTPTDCVNIAVAVLLEGRLPDLVVSGINTGWNLGVTVGLMVTVPSSLARARAAAAAGGPSGWAAPARSQAARHRRSRPAPRCSRGPTRSAG